MIPSRDLKRRDFIKGLCAVTALASASLFLPLRAYAKHHNGFDLMTYLAQDDNQDLRHLKEAITKVSFPLTKDIRGVDEWRRILNDDEFYVLREEGTERAFTSVYNDNKDEGIYHCRGCDLPLFPSMTKYESGTGWPSFWAPLDEKLIGIKTDKKFFMSRTEVHCGRCEGHLGHVFKDGPKPTGLRYCLNGVSLRFEERA